MVLIPLLWLSGLSGSWVAPSRVAALLGVGAVRGSGRLAEGLRHDALYTRLLVCDTVECGTLTRQSERQSERRQGHIDHRACLPPLMMGMSRS